MSNQDNQDKIKNGAINFEQRFHEIIRKPVHRFKESLFTSSSGYTNYRGFMNLCFLILFLSNFRVALENLIKYGILMDPFTVFTKYFSIPIFLPTIALVNIFILISLLIEKLSSTRMFMIIDEKDGEKENIKKIYLHKNIKLIIGIHLFILLFTPVFIIIRFYDSFNPLAAALCCYIYAVSFLKLFSYHMTNYWYREGISPEPEQDDHRDNDINDNNNVVTSKKSTSPPMVSYPDNLTLADIYYFMVVPTLCYELNFPRTDRIRKSFLIKRFIEMIVLLQIQICLIQQWIVPAIENSVEPFMEMSYSKMLERLLKLAVPNHIIWLIFFYCTFHSTMNFYGELYRFADREFYRDWWNSESIEYFWRTWNIPVYRWSVRHVYLPLLSCGFKNNTAAIIVFLISAFFHEYLVSVPLNMFRIWAFAGMILQLPLAKIVKKLPKNLANFAVWISFIIGQPVCILMYCHDYYVIHIANPK